MSAPKKQTAVEWLMEKINHTGWGNIMIDIPKEFIEQAKQMEKEQIVNAVDGFPLDKRHLNGEQYYNETYKQKQ